MNKIIIVEGPQGSGKTTVTNWLREQMTSTNLLRLSGIKDKTIMGEQKSFKYHYALIHAIEDTADCDINYVLDRSFITDYVYGKLGHKEYTFKNPFHTLSRVLDRMTSDYEIYVINLYVSQPVVFESRLNRDKGEYIRFSADESIKQQNMYIDTFDNEMSKKCPNVQFIHVDTMDGWSWKNEISEYCRLNEDKLNSNIKGDK